MGKLGARELGGDWGRQAGKAGLLVRMSCCCVHAHQQQTGLAVVGAAQPCWLHSDHCEGGGVVAVCLGLLIYLQWSNIGSAVASMLSLVG